MEKTINGIPSPPYAPAVLLMLLRKENSWFGV